MVVTKDNVKVGDKVLFTKQGKNEYYFFLSTRAIRNLVYFVVASIKANNLLIIQAVDYKGKHLQYIHTVIFIFNESMLEFYEQ